MHSVNRLMLKTICFTLAISFITNLTNHELWAAGKKRPPPPCNPEQPGTPQLSTPSPVRKTLLPQIATKPFQLPNGVPADLTFDMQTILNTSVTSSLLLSPTDPGGKDPCNAHLELRSAVTTFQLDVFEAGVSFGFSPTGPVNTISSITGVAKVKVGLIAMDFSLWQCKDGLCSSIAAATSNHLVAGSEIIFDVDFDTIKVGAELIFNPVLSSTIRKIMNDAMKQLASSSRIPDLPWTAKVRSHNSMTGILIFDEGTQSRLLPNQTFVVYAPTDNTPQGVCDVFQTVAYIHTSSVYPVSSEALVDQVLDPRGVHKGDVVMIRRVNRPAL